MAGIAATPNSSHHEHFPRDPCLSPTKFQSNWLTWDPYMARFQIKREVLENTRDRSILNAEERTSVDRVLGAKAKGECQVNVGELPLSFLRALLDDHRLTANQRAAVIMHVYGMTEAD